MIHRNRYIVAAVHPWNRKIFQETLSRYPGTWFLADSPEKLTASWVKKISPRYIFFLHWSWKVPADIFSAYECVCFHMTDVPYGRGGSPLQNLIARGHKTTKLSALRMVEALDAGPVYMKRSLDLSGSAEEIYKRASQLSAEMIRKIVRNQTRPNPQKGRATTFRRRKPEESQIQKADSLGQLYNFIRMLDADGYPRAFLNQGNFCLSFSKASLKSGELRAEVTITKKREK